MAFCRWQGNRCAGAEAPDLVNLGQNIIRRVGSGEGGKRKHVWLHTVSVSVSTLSFGGCYTQYVHHCTHVQIVCLFRIKMRVDCQSSIQDSVSQTKKSTELAERTRNSWRQTHAFWYFVVQSKLCWRFVISFFFVAHVFSLSIAKWCPPPPQKSNRERPGTGRVTLQIFCHPE